MYPYEYTSASSAIGFGIGVVLFVCALIVAISVFFIVCRWKIYVKCGLPGWHCIIPIYNIISITGALCCPNLGYISAVTMVCPIILSLLGSLIGGFVAVITGLLTFACAITSFVVSYIVEWRIIQGLEKPSWYMALCIFCPIVYYPLMAFSA